MECILLYYYLELAVEGDSFNPYDFFSNCPILFFLNLMPPLSAKSSLIWTLMYSTLTDFNEKTLLSPYYLRIQKLTLSHSRNSYLGVTKTQPPDIHNSAGYLFCRGNLEISTNQTIEELRRCSKPSSIKSAR